MKIFWKVCRESIKVLLIGSILSSIGGFTLKSIEEKLIIFLPFVIVLPSLNDLIGDFGIIITSRFTSFLYEKEKRMKTKLKRGTFIKTLFKDTSLIVLFSIFYLTFLTLIISYIKKFPLDITFILKFLLCISITVIVLFLLTFMVAIVGGYYEFKKGRDPDLILIPITTSIADLGAMIVFAGLIYLVF